MNLTASVFMSLFLLSPVTNELQNAIDFCSTHPKIIQDILIFSVTGGCGQLFIFYTLEHFGSLSLVTVTVTRKMFSILLSVLWFGHHLSIGQW